MDCINILHIEDDPDDAFFLRRALAKAALRCAVHRVPSGEAALQYLRGTDGFADRRLHPLPQLMVLDLKLPGLSGFQVLDFTRSQAAFRALPVVVLSGSSLEEDRRHALQLGASAFLVKSSDYSQVVAAVTALVSPPRAACSPMGVSTQVAA